MTWKADVLPVVGDDPELWTIAECVAVLGLTRLQGVRLRSRIRYTHVFPVGRRRSALTVYTAEAPQPPGRYAKVYRAEEMIELVELLCITTGTYRSPGAEGDGASGDTERE